MAVSKRLRYEILRRDNHACRYCGATAPDVVLTVDHVIPTALGGSDQPDNLVAACRDCNAGKSASQPDQTLVGDVAADALRWARAIKAAQAQSDVERAKRDEYEIQVGDFFTGMWANHYDDDLLPWEQAETNCRFLDNGLTTDDLYYALAATARRNPRDPWTYYCGVAWKMLRQRQDAARALLDAGTI